MLRYVCPVILAGGKSSRFGENKVFFKKNNLCALDLRLNFFFDLGFSWVYISGCFNGYLIVIDDFLYHGPVIGIFSTYSYFLNKYFTHFLFFPIDLNFFCKKNIFSIFFRSEIFYSYCFNLHIFPFLLAASFNVIYSLFYVIFFLDCLSLSFFLNFILLERFYVNKFCFNFFLNFNIYYNYFLFIL
ncbi:MAG TPA: NTP transferase domain-containing protein [Candidatus Azoamicus sp.]